MRSSEIETLFNKQQHNKNIELTLTLDKEKSDSKAGTRYFNFTRKNAPPLGHLLIEKQAPGRFSIKTSLGLEAIIQQQFLWNEQGKFEFWMSMEDKPLQNKTYSKAKEWLTVTAFISPLFQKLNNMTYSEIHDNINPVLKDFDFFKGKKHEDFDIKEEFKYENLAEFYKAHNVTSNKLQKIIREKSTNMDITLKLCNLCKYLGDLDVDLNHIVTYITPLMEFMALTDLTKYKFLNKDNFKRFCLDLVKFSSTKELPTYQAQVGDIDRFETQLKGLNPNVELPKVSTFLEYHCALVNLIKIEEDKRDNHPYTWTEEEHALNGTEVDGYVITLPNNKPDLRRWGMLQNHCIGGYNFDRDNKLISLWKDGLIVSCLEITKGRNGFEKRQHRGKYNQDPPIEAGLLQKIESLILEVYNPKPKLEDIFREEAA